MYSLLKDSLPSQSSALLAEQFPQTATAPSMATSIRSNADHLSPRADGDVSLSLSPTVSTSSSRTSPALESISSSTTVETSDFDQSVSSTVSSNQDQQTYRLRKTTKTDTCSESFDGPVSSRSSGRARKPTAKAQSFPLRKPSQRCSVTIDTGLTTSESTSRTGPYNIGDFNIQPTKKKTSNRSTQIAPGHSPTTSPDNHRSLSAGKIPTTAAALSNETQASVIDSVELPVKRVSARERKLTTKAIEATTTQSPWQSASTILPAPITARHALKTNRDGRPTKIVKLSYNGSRGTKITSKLRFSTTLNDIGPRPPPNIEPIHANPPKISQSKMSQPLPPVVPRGRTQTAHFSKPKTSVVIDLTDADDNDKVALLDNTQQREAAQASEKNPNLCNLSCLSGHSKLLALATLASESPDSDDEETPGGPGLYEKWLTRAQDRFCRCEKVPHALKAEEKAEELIDQENVEDLNEPPSLTAIAQIRRSLYLPEALSGTYTIYGPPEPRAPTTLGVDEEYIAV